ncbi:MAG: hypothetical protein FGM40_01140 [Rhodocyclaceae bacterium]|nr:hypothetical protein [Rhodocyclaceae bacterium]
MTRQRLILLGLFAAFAAPFLVGFGLFAGGWRPDTVHPHGVLVQPAPVLRAPQWSALLGSDPVPGQWTLAMLAPAECDAACRKTLWLMQQIESTQAREASRVQRAVLVADAPSASLREAVEQIGQTVIWQGPLADLRAALPSAGEGAVRLAIIDPQGSLMMVYPDAFDPSGVRRDLERLLKFSWIG